MQYDKPGIHNEGPGETETLVALFLCKSFSELDGDCYWLPFLYITAALLMYVV